jgi:hypothetical protein
MEIKFIIRKTHVGISIKNHLITLYLWAYSWRFLYRVERDNILVLASLFFWSFNTSLRVLCNLAPAQQMPNEVAIWHMGVMLMWCIYTIVLSAMKD